MYIICIFMYLNDNVIDQFYIVICGPHFVILSMCTKSRS